MGKKSRNKKMYKRILPKIIKWEKEKLKKILGITPRMELERFSFLLQNHNVETWKNHIRADVRKPENLDTGAARDGMEVITEIRAKKGVPFQTPVAEQKDVIAEDQPNNLKKNQFPVWMSTRKQKKIIKKNRKIRKIKLNKMKEVLKNKREVMKLKKKGKKR